MSTGVGIQATREARELLARAQDALAVLASAISSCHTDELDDVVQEVAGVGLAVETCLVEVAREAMERGRPRETGATDTSCLLQQSAQNALSPRSARMSAP